MFWWAAIFRTPLSMFDKMLLLSKSQCSTMRTLRSHNFRDAVSDLLTITMHLQDALSRFHRPALHEVDLCVHVSSASTCTLSLHESQSYCAVRAQDNCTRRAIAHLAPLVSRCDTLASPPTSAINSDSPELEQTMLCFLEEAYTIPRVFNGNIDRNSDSRVAATVHDVSSPIQHQSPERPNLAECPQFTLRSARNSRNLKIATHNHVARTIPNQISQPTLDADFITSGSFADVSGQLTNCVF